MISVSHLNGKNINGMEKTDVIENRCPSNSNAQVSQDCWTDWNGLQERALLRVTAPTRIHMRFFSKLQSNQEMWLP